MTKSCQIMFGLFLAMVVAAPVVSHAAGGGGGGGSNGSEPPTRTETTKNCFTDRQWDPEIKRYVRYSKPVNGVWDPNERRCIRPDKAGYLESKLLGDAVRELAYAGRYSEAQEVLSQMNQSDGLVLTYWGFTYRKLGETVTANLFYEKAISIDHKN